MVFEASQNWERNSRYPINLRVMVIKLPQGEKFRENLPPYSPDLNKIDQRKVAGFRVASAKNRISLIVYVLAIEDVLCFASGADESGCYT
jgi:hypothetical protein